MSRAATSLPVKIAWQAAKAINEWGQSVRSDPDDVKGSDPLDLTPLISPGHIPAQQEEHHAQVTQHRYQQRRDNTDRAVVKTDIDQVDEKRNQ